MKAVVTMTKNGTRFFLTPLALATDIADRALEFRDASDAQLEVNRQNTERAWTNYGIQWEAAYLLHNGEIALNESVVN